MARPISTLFARPLACRPDVGIRSKPLLPISWLGLETWETWEIGVEQAPHGDTSLALCFVDRGEVPRLAIVSIPPPLIRCVRLLAHTTR